jgi:hypothetical protein
MVCIEGSTRAGFSFKQELISFAALSQPLCINILLVGMDLDS